MRQLAHAIVLAYKSVWLCNLDCPQGLLRGMWDERLGVGWSGVIACQHVRLVQLATGAGNVLRDRNQQETSAPLLLSIRIEATQTVLRGSWSVTGH